MIGTASEVVRWLFQQEPGQIFEAKARKKHRSLTQNAYYWSLLNQLARVLGYPDSEVHGYMLRDYGVCEVFGVRRDVPLDGFARYWDEIPGKEYVMDGREYRLVKVYKGSSEMDSTEFSHLLDGMRRECEAQDIPVMTPEEVARLRFVGEVS